MDIAPGGIKFESAPFKLTAEMIEVMGGKGVSVEPYWRFCDLCVKAYLSIRPYAGQLINMVAMMLDSKLPCFKGDTLGQLRYRFQLEKNERAAARHMISCIQDSLENRRTVWYDAFQKATNGNEFVSCLVLIGFIGIPY